MKREKTKLAVLPALLVVLAAGFATGAVTAQPEPEFAGAGGAGVEEGGFEAFGPPRGFGRHPGMHRPGPMTGLHRALRQLDLSASQRDEIRAIFEAEHEQLRTHHERMRALGAELQEQVENDPFNEDAVRAKAEALAALRVELAILHARQAGQVRETLTPEQLEELERMKDERDEFRDRRRRRFERHGEGRSRR